MKKSKLSTLHRRHATVEWIQKGGCDAARKAFSGNPVIDEQCLLEEAWFGLVRLDEVEYYTFSTGTLRNKKTIIWYTPVIPPQRRKPGPKPGSKQPEGSKRKPGPPAMSFQVTIQGPIAEAARQNGKNKEQIKDAALGGAIEFINNL